MFQPKKIFGIFAGVSVVFILRKYCAGGQCTAERDLSNDIAVVTGGNTGIGKQTVIRLSQLGCKVIIGSRDQEKSKRLVQQLSSHKGKVSSYRLDLADKSSIQEFAKQIKKQIGNQPLNYLINNAGVMAIPEKQTTKQGLQMQIGVNYFGHFYLTHLLWENLKKSQNPRIINVSSRAHKSRGEGFDIDFNDMNFQNTNYGAWKAYSRSKKANILFTKQLQRRMNQANINGLSISLHPGVVRTQLFRYMTDSAWKKTVHSLITPFTYILMKSSKQGAQTSLYGVLEREQKIQKGQYYADCKVAPLLAKQCESEEAAKKLWEVSEKTFGIKFNI